jgi:hypothetical protein
LLTPISGNRDGFFYARQKHPGLGGGPLTLGGFALLRADHPTATRALPIHRTLILCLATKRVTPLGEGPATAGLSPLFLSMHSAAAPATGQ